MSGVHHTDCPPSFFLPASLAIFGLLAFGTLTCRSGSGGEEPTRLVSDGVGRSMRVPHHPRRLVSLAPSVTESLFALGVGDRVVGVTDFCDYPREAAARPRVGGLVNPNWEVILALKPDLLIATTAGNDRSLAGQSASFQLPVFFLDTPNLDGMLRSLSLLGNLLGAEEASRGLVKSLQGRLSDLGKKSRVGPRPKVLFLVWDDPILVPGRRSFLDDVLFRAGCNSITSDAPPGWPTYELETILMRKPDWILAARQNSALLERLKEKPGWRDLEAVRSGRVVSVSEAIERPSPRVLDAMEEVQHRLRDESPPEKTTARACPARPRGDHPPSLPSVI